MTNPRPSYNYLLIEASIAAAFSPATCASIGFQTFEKLPGNRIRLHTCTGGPAALIDKWRSGKRDYLVVEFRNGQPVARYHIDQAWPVSGLAPR